MSQNAYLTLVSMATGSELLSSHGNESISSWLQLHAWSQSVILAHSDVVKPPAGVAMTTARDVVMAIKKDSRFQSATSGKCSDSMIITYHGHRHHRRISSVYRGLLRKSRKTTYNSHL